MSLFNGAGSIHLNTSAQRLEEEEAIEDQKRRNEEVNFIVSRVYKYSY